MKTEQSSKETKLDYNKVKELLQNKPNGYNKLYINRQLHEKENLRKVFLAVIKNEPARISEVFEDSLLTKPTCYAQLYKLLDLHLIERTFVLDVMNKNTPNKAIEAKFLRWTKNMPPQLKRYYLAKTSFWCITSNGRTFATKAYEYEQEYRRQLEDE